jgi:uncharacterized protein YdeI (YjbR/CyaY-like superfamily)
MKPIYFLTPEDFRAWLSEDHGSVEELWVGYYRKATGTPSITWPESVDEALCYGWIDGLRKSVDGERYKIRFTPRRETSVWSAVNLKRMKELIVLGRVAPGGLAIYEARDPAQGEGYSFEQLKAALPAAQKGTFQANAKAWAFFQSQPPGYRKQATWWVVSAKREETRARRLVTLLADSEAGVRIKQFRR